MQAQSTMMAGYMKQRFGERGHRVWRIILEHKYLQVLVVDVFTHYMMTPYSSHKFIRPNFLQADKILQF
jgi:hypothetical protein